MNRLGKSSLVLGVLAVALGASRVASAQDEDNKKRAQELLREGNELFRKNQHAAALASFRAAYQAFPSAKLFLNIGKSEKAVGRPDRAVAAYERFVAEATDAPKNALAEARREIEQLGPTLAKVEITCTEADAEIAIDGEPAARSPVPQPLWVIPGERTFTAEKTGFRIVSITRSISRGERASVELHLESLASPAPLASAEGAPGAVAVPYPGASAPGQPAQASPPAAGTSAAPPPPPTAAATTTRRKWAWIASAGAGAMALGGGVAGIMMKMRYDDLKTSCGSGSPGWPGCTDDEVASVRLRRNVANTLWIGAGLSAVAAGVLFYTDQGARPVRVDAAITAGGAALRAEARF